MNKYRVTLFVFVGFDINANTEQDAEDLALLAWRSENRGHGTSQGVVYDVEQLDKESIDPFGYQDGVEA